MFTITAGGLGSANLPYTIYQTFYQAHDYGLASALSIVIFLIVATISAISFRQTKALEEIDK